MRTLIVCIALTVAASAAAQEVDDGPDVRLPPTYGEVRLPGGSAPYPYVVQITAGGDIDAAPLGQACHGWIARAPDFRLRYSGGGAGLALVIAARGDNVTLVINDASGAWHCADEAAVIDAPASGQYDIWLSASEAGATAPAVLEISER